MPSFLFALTLASLCVYVMDLYSHHSTIVLLHGIYTVLMIVYNSTVKQSHAQFKWLSNKETEDCGKSTIECKICDRPKPPRFYHCRRCGLCIFRMDHHCDWLGCCVGQFNYKLYIHILANLLLIGLYCLYQTILVSQSWVSTRSIVRLVFACFLLWETVRMIMGCVETITNNQTLIETYKRVRGTQKPIYEKLQQFLGSPNPINWTFPTHSSHQSCNIWEPTYPISQQQSTMEHTYADEYIYGPDEEQEKSQ